MTSLVKGDDAQAAHRFRRSHEQDRARGRGGQPEEPGTGPRTPNSPRRWPHDTGNDLGTGRRSRRRRHESSGRRHRCSIGERCRRHARGSRRREADAFTSSDRFPCSCARRPRGQRRARVDAGTVGRRRGEGTARDQRGDEHRADHQHERARTCATATHLETNRHVRLSTRLSPAVVRRSSMNRRHG